MPTAPLGTLLDTIADNIYDALSSTMQDDFDSDLQVTSRLQPFPSVPCIDVYWPYDNDLRNPDSSGFGEDPGTVQLTVRLRVGTVDNWAGQDLLLRCADEEDELSVAEAIWGDGMLNGLAGSVEVLGPSPMQVYSDPGGDGGAYLGCQWSVRITRRLS